MRRARQLALSLILAAALGAVAGCDGTGGPVLTPDGGPVDGGPLPPDAREIDRERPRVIGSTPGQGATGVAVDASISIVLSEAMDAGAGTVRVEASGAAVDVATSWSEDGTELVIDPVDTLPSDARVRVLLEGDFADLAGNTLAVPFVLTFDVGDHEPPVVVSSDPAQGATDRSARMSSITIEFDELMLSDRGALALEGGAGTLGDLAWIDGRTVSAPFLGLAYESSYRVVLSGFEDAAGNALDASVYLDDGAIAFGTSSDVDAPRVADSVPSEGQVNVALRGTPSVVLVFDEPMDTSEGIATLSAGGLSVELTGGVWSEGGRRLTLPIAGRLYPASAHSIELGGFRDVAGNALDAATYLEDGRLDFDTGADVSVPIVVFSYPNEGSSDADHRLATIELAFDRAMDATGATTLRVDDGVAPFDAPLTWNLAGTRALLDVAGRVHAGRAYDVDVRGMVDVAGDPVDPDHPYLGDGVLDFSTRTPTGEQCRDELRITEATLTTPTGGYEWVIAESAMSTVDNGRPCQYPGASSSILPDAVIVYRKSTANGSSGGRYLHVSVDSPSPAGRTTLAVYRDACGEAAAGPGERLTCQWDRYRWEQYLDVGAGDYYVWAAVTSGTTPRELVVRIEEVDEVPLGESCARPHTDASPLYTAPIGPDGEHVWAIPEHGYHAVDMDVSWPGSGAASCDADQVQGTDVVVQFDKSRADSLVSVVVEPGSETSSAIYRLNVEALSACDARAAATASLACTSGLWDSTAAAGGPRRLTFAAPAGPTFLWVANQDQDNDSVSARVRVQEIDALPGTSCGNALPLPATGSTAIAPSSLARMSPPSCFESGALQDGITWYRLTSTQRATLVRADVAGTPASVGAIAVVAASDGSELGCTADATAVPQLALVPPGSDVCVAVRNGSGITRLDTAQVAYDGVMGVPTHLDIERPLDATGGAEQAITSETWIAVTPTTLYMGVSSGSSPTSTNGVVIAPIGGAARADFRDDFALLGNGGLAIGEALWSLDDATAASTTSRLYRLVSASGTWSLMAWDGAMSWPGDGFDAITYDGTDILVTNDYLSASVPVQLRTFSVGSAGPSTLPVTVHPSLRDVVAIAADATWLYLAGGALEGTTVRGVYRIRRAELGTGALERIATLPISTVRSGMAIDSRLAAQYLYVRASNGDVHAVVDPGGATPQHVGVLSTLGTTSDVGLAYDAAGRSLYLFETETISTGNFVRLD